MERKQIKPSAKFNPFYSIPNKLESVKIVFLNKLNVNIRYYK